MIDRAPSGFPALRKFLRGDFPVLLRALDPFLRNLNPILTGLGLYKTRGHLADGQRRRGDQRASTSLRNGEQIHFLRAARPVRPGIAGDLPQPHYHQPQQRLHPAARLQAPRQGPAQLRHPPVQLRDHRDASTRTRRTNPPSTSGPKAMSPKATDFFNRLKHYAFGEQESSATHPGSGLQHSRRPSSRSTAAARRRPTSTPSNRANRACGRRAAAIAEH